jgi:hypothetical protein
MITISVLWRRTGLVVGLAGTCVVALLVAAPAAQGPGTARYRTYEELTADLRALEKNHASLVRLVDLGRSHEGRTIWAVEIANAAAGTTPPDARPALFVAANFEGDQVVGGEIALYLARHLATSYPTSAETKRVLDEHAVYIVPRVNPDGAERMFDKVKSFRRTNARATDADNDGRVDEDGPDDLNGDGVIGLMRIRDQKGPYMLHRDDPRLLARADASRGEAGGWSVFWEGVDNDADGFLNEDGPGGVDLNRNFQHRYPYYTADAGPHMVSEPEARAVMDYILTRRNVAAMLTFGASDNLITAPTRQGALGSPNVLDLLAFADQSLAGAREVGRFSGGAGPDVAGGGRGGGGAPQTRPPGQQAPRPPATSVNGDDVEYFRTVSDRYRALTSIAAAPATRTPAGAFFEYGYYQFGVPSFSTPGWGLEPAPGGQPGSSGGDASQDAAPSQAAEPAAPVGRGGRRGGGGPPAPAGRGGRQGGPPAAAPSGDDASGSATFDRRLVQGVSDGFLAWTPFTHPTLGAVEIGGFKPYAIINPPAGRIDALGRSHAEFAIYLTSLFPKIGVADLTAEPLGAGLYRIKAEVVNTGYLPTATAHGVTSRSVAPVMVQLDVAPDAIVSGDPKTNFIATLAGSGRRQAYQWIVRAKPGQPLVLTVVSQKGGRAERSVTLK